MTLDQIIEKAKGYEFHDTTGKCNVGDIMLKMKNALEFYAKLDGPPNDGPWGINSNDFGAVARETLKSSGELRD